MRIIQQNTESFPYEAIKKLYEENRQYLFQEFDFDTLYKKMNGNLWAIVDVELIGVIFFHFKEGKWFLNGFSGRKKYKYIQEAIEKMCEQYFERWGITEIYSKTEYRHAKSALIRAGFKQISQNTFRKDKHDG